VIVLDAGVLIALVNGNDAHHQWARGFFTDTLHEDLRISALTYAEVLVHPTRANVADTFEQNIRGLQLEICALSANDSRPLAALRSSSPLRMPDAASLHLASRLGAGLATTDGVLATVAAQHIPRVIHPRQ
jgi:predicted nucleic acid-binding protein